MDLLEVCDDSQQLDSTPDERMAHRYRTLDMDPVMGNQVTHVLNYP